MIFFVFIVQISCYCLLGLSLYVSFLVTISVIHFNILKIKYKKHFQLDDEEKLKINDDARDISQKRVTKAH